MVKNKRVDFCIILVGATTFDRLVLFVKTETETSFFKLFFKLNQTSTMRSIYQGIPRVSLRLTRTVENRLRYA